MNTEMGKKQTALIALTLAARAFVDATNDALDAKFPGIGRGAENRRLLDENLAHVCISLQVGSGQVQAALALVTPEFVATLENPEMTLKASLRAILGDPEKVNVINLAALN